MYCLACSTEYTRMAGVQRFRQDFGYCSLDCLIQSKPPCPTCNIPLTPNASERISKFFKRRFCTQRCAALASGAEAIASGRIQAINHMVDRTAPERRAKLRAAWDQHRADGSAEEMNRKRSEGNKRWRQANPDAFQAMLAAQKSTRQMRNTPQQASQRMKAFFASPEGSAMKEHLRSIHAGKPRPPLVTAKMKASLRQFWDSPEGVALRERVSLLHTNGMPDAPYGPGWIQQAAHIRRRDRCCIICGTTRAETRRVLDVHHITPRRMFGYVPGQNSNYRWANHAANLITLCQPCHRKVELKTLALPSEYTERAHALWIEFTQEIR